jgi:hypothetical protein
VHWRCRQHDRLVERQQHLDVRGQCANQRCRQQRQADHPIQEQLDQLGLPPGPHQDVDVRVSGIEARQRRADEAARQRFEDADGDSPPLSDLSPARHFHASVQHLQRPPGVRQEAVTKVGQARGTPAAYE